MLSLEEGLDHVRVGDGLERLAVVAVRPVLGLEKGWVVIELGQIVSIERKTDLVLLKLIQEGLVVCDVHGFYLYPDTT